MKKARPVKLLSGGNPQIPKADGNAPVRGLISKSRFAAQAIASS